MTARLSLASGFVAIVVTLAVLVAQPAPAFADHVGGMTEMTPGHAAKMSPATVTTGGMVLAPWRIALMFGQMSMDDKKIMFDGERVHRSHHMSMTRSAIGAAMGLPHDLQVSVMVPLHRTEANGIMHPMATNDRGGNGFSFNGKVVGQGDVALQLKKRFLL